MNYWKIVYVQHVQIKMSLKNILEILDRRLLTREQRDVSSVFQGVGGEIFPIFV